MAENCACDRGIQHTPALVVDQQDLADVGLEGLHPEGTRRHVHEQAMDLVESVIQGCQHGVYGSTSKPEQASAGQPLHSTWPEPSRAASYPNKNDDGCTSAADMGPPPCQPDAMRPEKKSARRLTTSSSKKTMSISFAETKECTNGECKDPKCGVPLVTKSDTVVVQVPSTIRGGEDKKERHPKEPRSKPTKSGSQSVPTARSKPTKSGSPSVVTAQRKLCHQIHKA